MFYSPSCVFCHQMEPYFRSYAGEYRDSVIFVRLNILTSQWTAERYGVKSTPDLQVLLQRETCPGDGGRDLPCPPEKDDR